MDLDLKSEYILCQVKAQINKEKIKLWLHPYHHEVNGVAEEERQALQNLAEQISKQLNIALDECLSALINLQNLALDHLKSNEVFKETGVARIKVKVSGNIHQVLYLSISLAADCSELINEISQAINIPNTRIKLVSAGRVLNPSESLASQGVKNAMQIMVVILAPTNKIEEDDKQFKSLERTKKDVKLLAGRSNVNNDFYFEVENQSGKSLNIPYHERKALVTAMALHEKGRAALMREDFSMALILFLEADKEFSQCDSQLLNTCDNYALLHLDIAWCYLCLQNPAQIPDAERRLRLCEENFHKSYGPNLERLLAIKGTTGNEQALFMRLHLLQGVVCFHQNKRAQARLLFERAQTELNKLKVDDHSLCLLMELGFTNAEACLGLRTTHGNIEAAEEFLHDKRRREELAKEANRLKQEKDRERHVLGLCSDGQQFCEPELVNQLVGMGFSRAQSVAALKHSNNNINEAVTIIQETPHLLPANTVIPEEAIAQVVSLGIDPAAAREALEKCENLEKLVKNLNSFNPDELSQPTASTSASIINFIEDLRKKQKVRLEKERKAYERMSEDLRENASQDNLTNISLDQEEQFLIQYLSLLN